MPSFNTKPPVLSGNTGERSATWLELFFDLVFVVTVAAMVTQLEHHLTWAGVGFTALLFLPIWWLWMEYSYHADLYDDGSIFHQTMVIAGMAGLAEIALVIINGDISQDPTDFILTYLFLLSVVWVMYLRAWWLTRPNQRWFPRRYLGSIGLAMGIWALSLFLAPPLQYVAWVLSVFVQAAASPSIYIYRDDFPQQHSHMPERFGLFTIIVLGEGIVAVTSTGVIGTQDLSTVFIEATGFLLIVAAWKLYFYESTKDVIDEVLSTPEKRSTWKSFYYGYGHYFLYFGIILISVATLLNLESMLHPVEEVVHGSHEATTHGDDSHTASHGIVKVLLHGGCMLFIAAITLIHWATPASLPRLVIYMRLGVFLGSGLLLLFPMGTAVEMMVQLLLFGLLIFGEYRYYLSHDSLPGTEAADIS